MVYSCKMCKSPSMRLYQSEDGELKDVCANCKAKYDHQKKIEEQKSQEPSEIAKINKRIDKMAQAQKANDKRFFEVEAKNGKLEKRIEKLEERILQLAEELESTESK